jgi:hypothetical protein
MNEGDLHALGLIYAPREGYPLADTTCLHMELNASMEIAGEGALLLWSHRFSVPTSVRHIVVDYVVLILFRPRSPLDHYVCSRPARRAPQDCFHRRAAQSQVCSTACMHRYTMYSLRFKI